jgi:hypothetical protein
MKTLAIILLAIGLCAIVSGHWLTGILIESGAWQCWTWDDDEDEE